MARNGNAPKSDPVSVSAKLREAYSWIEEMATKAVEKAKNARRKKEQLKGPQLTASELVGVLDELEDIQKQLNPLLVQRENLLKRVLPHWGHTGIEEVVHPTGKSLLVSSFYYKVGNPDKLQADIPESQWLRVSKRTLDAKLAMAEAEKDEGFRKKLADNIVATMKLSFFSPSSRTPKSGQCDDEEADE